MVMATETENNASPATEKDSKNVKDIKDALKDETPPDNKQQQEEATAKAAEKDEAVEKKSVDDNTNDATAAVATATNAAASTPTAATAAAAATESATSSPKPLTVHKPSFEKDIVYLYQFSRTPLLPSISPYCLKVETWLRLNDVKYENVDHKMKFRSKKGNLPFIELNGEEMGDSKIIIRDLGQKFDKDLDAALTTEQRSVSHAMISMIENHLAWVITCWRTKNMDLVFKGYKVNLQHALGTRIPERLLSFFFKFTFGRKGAKKVKAQGMGNHTPEEVAQFGCDDLKVLCDMLSDKPFFFGDEPTTLDVAAFAHLAQILYIEKDTPYSLRDYMQENCPNLVGHCSRMKERCFPDWEEICTSLEMNTHLPKKDKDTKEETKETKESKEEKEGDKEKAEKEDKEAEKDKELDENKEKEKDGK